MSIIKSIVGKFKRKPAAMAAAPKRTPVPPARPAQAGRQVARHAAERSRVHVASAGDSGYGVSPMSDEPDLSASFVASAFGAFSSGGGGDFGGGGASGDWSSSSSSDCSSSSDSGSCGSD